MTKFGDDMFNYTLRRNGQKMIETSNITKAVVLKKLSIKIGLENIILSAKNKQDKNDSKK